MRRRLGCALCAARCRQSASLCPRLRRGRLALRFTLRLWKRLNDDRIGGGWNDRTSLMQRLQHCKNLLWGRDDLLFDWISMKRNQLARERVRRGGLQRKGNFSGWRFHLLAGVHNRRLDKARLGRGLRIAPDERSQSGMGEQ